MRTILHFSLLLVVLSAAVPALAQKFDPAARAAAIAPYLDDQAIVVAHVDPARIDPAATIDKITELLPHTAEQKAEAKAGAKTAATFLADFAKAGGRDIYLVVSLADVPKAPMFLIVPVKNREDAPDVAGLLLDGPLRGAAFETVEPLGNAVFAGSKAALARLKTLRAAPRPELATAFEAAGDTAAQIVVVPTADNRRVIRESLPSLPPEIGGGSGGALADGVQWAAVGINLPPKISLNLTIQSKDVESAAALAKVIGAAYALAGKSPEVRQAVPKFDDLVKLVTPAVKGNRLTLAINDENGGVTQLTAALAQPVNVAREAARRAQSSNNLKQLALTIHNYHDTYRKFPLAATRSKDGKPLLSWRVQILPFLGEDELYKQFHLDETWDSEHNRKLIEKMPKTLASPLANLMEPGKTVYLAPAAEGTAFGGKEALQFSKIVDGTSNTIMIVEATPEKAVVWTKPDDLNVDLEKPLAGLVATGAKGFLVAFCDGSVRFVSAKVDAATLKALFTIGGGEVVDSSKF